MPIPAPVAWNREFALAIACCGKAAHETIGERAARVDWDCFIALVDRHRIGGLAWRVLSEAQAPLPQPVREALATRARAIAEANMRATVECARLLGAFTSARVPLLFVKGLTLSALAYGDAFLKMSADIDVLVEPDAIATAAKLLERIGYRCTLPTKGANEAAAWHRHHKESVWLHDHRHIAIDLHSRLADQPTLLRSLSVHSSNRHVSVAPNVALPTLGPDQLFAYLCVHGASSAWFRLKWIADLFALHGEASPQLLTALYNRAKELGAGRSVDQALLLMDLLFGIDLEMELRSRLKASRANRLLAGIAVTQLGAGEPTNRRLGTMMIHASQLLLKPGVVFKAEETVRQLRSAFGRKY